MVDFQEVRLEDGGRAIVAVLETNLPRGLFSAGLSAGIADARANARPYASRWNFEVGLGNASLSVRSVTPSRQFAVPGGDFPELTVELSGPISSTDVEGFTFEFTAAGADGRLNSADDLPAGIGSATLLGPTLIRVTPPQGF